MSEVLALPCTPFARFPVFFSSFLSLLRFCVRLDCPSWGGKIECVQCSFHMRQPSWAQWNNRMCPMRPACVTEALDTHVLAHM